MIFLVGQCRRVGIKYDKTESHFRFQVSGFKCPSECISNISADLISVRINEYVYLSATV